MSIIDIIQQNQLQPLGKIRHSCKIEETFDWAQNIYRESVKSPYNDKIQAICLYLMYSIVYDLHKNPFLNYFIKQYISGGHFSIIISSFLLSSRGHELDELTLDQLPQDPYAIDEPHLSSILNEQWFDKHSIDRIFTHPLVWIHKNDEICDASELQRLVLKEIESESLPSLSDLCTPFNKASNEIFSIWLRNDHHATRAVNCLTRTKATNISVDCIHSCIVDGSMADKDSIAVLVHEFVQFNLNDRQPSINVVRILCTFLLSLVKNNSLQPLDDYKLLFSGFVQYIAQVPEAGQLYALCTLNNG